MINRKERKIITVENYRRMTMFLGRGANIAWCEQCGAETVMFAPNEAAAVLQTSAREIFRRVETGEIHFLETKAGALLICHNSLLCERNSQELRNE